jgi:hypothetical protein
MCTDHGPPRFTCFNVGGCETGISVEVEFSLETFMEYTPQVQQRNILR